MNSDVHVQNDKARISQAFDKLSRRSRRRDISEFFYFMSILGLLFSFVGMIPDIIDEIITLFIGELSKSGHDIIFVLTILIFIGLIVHFLLRLRTTKTLSDNQKQFVALQRIKKDISKSSMDETKVPKDTVNQLISEFAIIKYIILSASRLNGLQNEVAVTHMNTLLTSLNDKIINSLRQSRNLPECMEILDIISLMYLDGNIGNYRNEAQIKLDDITIKEEPIKIPSMGPIKGRTIYSQSPFIRFASFFFISILMVSTFLFIIYKAFSFTQGENFILADGTISIALSAVLYTVSKDY